MPYSNEYNRKIGEEIENLDQAQINHLKRDNLYFHTFPHTTTASNYVDEKGDYSEKPPMSGFAYGTWLDYGNDKTLGIKGQIDSKKSGAGLDEMGEFLDAVPNAFKQTSGVIPALIQKKLLGGKAKKEKIKKEKVKKESKKEKVKKSKKEGSGIVDTIDKIMPFLGQASLKKKDIAGVKSSDILGLVGGEKKKAGRPKGGAKFPDDEVKIRALGAGKIKEASQMKTQGQGKPLNAYQKLLKETKDKKGFKTLKETIKYIKDNNLYKK